MFWKTLILFASILTGSIAKINVQHWNSRDTTVHCGEEGISSYCENCAAIQFCNGDSDGTKTSCESGYSCLGNGDFSACVATSSVPGCACPATGITTIPDPYNNQNFILCDNGVGIVELCPNGGYFNPETKRCQENAITTTTLTPPIEQCNGEFDIAQVSCTTYRVCHSDGTTGAVYECEPGSYFDAATKECVQYLPFSCPYTETAKYFTDNHNCSQFHLCIEGTVIGQPNTCSVEQVFDEDEQMCIDATETNCNSVEDCGICPDDQTRFPIDCNRYYQCTADDGSHPYTPVETYCNPGFYFDPVSLEQR